jgi:N-glycosylase/DNA lyase
VGRRTRFGGLSVAAAPGIVTALSVLDFDVLLPREVRIHRGTRSTNPDREVVGRIGMRNAKRSGIPGLFQFAIVGVMVRIR